MELNSEVFVPFPRETVFATYRDHLADLLPYLSNVRSVDVKSRRDAGELVELVNEWRGGGEIPAAIRGILSESMLAWTDYASWNAGAFACEWHIESQALKEAMRARGRNVFFEDGPARTRLEISGTLEIDATKLRRMPALVARPLGRAAESFLVSRIQSNLVETAGAVSRYLSGVSGPPRS